MSLPTTQKKWILVSRPSPDLKAENFKLVEEKIDTELQDGQILVRVIYISIDPTLKGWTETNPPYTPQIPLGTVMNAAGLGVCVASKNPQHKVGEFFVGIVGFQEYAKINPDKDPLFSKVLDLPKFPLHVALNNFGITGLTAYFGIIQKGEPKEGETLLISGAAGATGLAAGYIGKLKGCRVVGIVGSDEKCDILVKEHGFDGAINYKKDNIDQKIKEQCPKGVDIYFDNVGGPLLDRVILNVNLNARIIICGAISQYNEKESYGIQNYMTLLFKEAQLRGLFLLNHQHEYHIAAQKILGWLESGKLPVFPAHIYKGIDKSVEALLGLFTGANFGKTIVEVSNPPAPYHE